MSSCLVTITVLLPVVVDVEARMEDGNAVILAVHGVRADRPTPRMLTEQMDNDDLTALDKAVEEAMEKSE